MSPRGDRNKERIKRSSGGTRQRNSKKRAGPKGLEPIERLLTEIRRLEASKAWSRAPMAARVAPVLAEFRERLKAAVDAATRLTSAGVNATVDASPEDKAPMRPDHAEGRGSATATTSRTPSVRIYTLDRISGEVASQLVVHEQVDEKVDPEDIEYRVACRGLTDEEPLTWVDAGLEGSSIRLFFPDDQYYGFPPFLDLEKPRRAQVGQTWRLLRPDRVAAATFILKSVETAESTRPAWKHGDIVHALYDGKQYVARFIRTETSLALVHWEVDGTFSTIPFEHIVGPAKTRRWRRDLEPEDVEIEG